MAVKDAVVSLILRAKNAISPSADDATESLRELDEQAGQLYDELKELEKQQAAAKGWKEAEDNAKSTSKALEDAVTAYEKLKSEGRQAGQTQAQYALAVRQARTAQSIANTEYNRGQRELAKYSRTLKKAGLDTNDLSQAEDKIQKELDQTQQKLNQATAEAREHGEALEQASQKGGRFGSAMSGIKGKLLGLVAGVGIFQTLRAGITKLITAGSDLEELERQFGALYGSMEEGKRVLEEVDRIAERNSQSLADTAQAARRLQVAGIDPLNGSLQSLIDANAKYGSGAQTLDTVITQLGQAWQGGRLQLEELNSITDSGIPIMEALGTVTGRTGAEIRQMASDGELGKDVMTQLIDELGRMSEGAGAERAKNFTGILESLRKEFTDFFALAAKSGALDSLKQRMNELLITLRDMQKDGSIKEWAQGVSDSFSTALSVVERFGAGFAIFWNSLTAGFRTSAAIWLGVIGSIAEGFSKLTGLIGAGELSASLKEFADNAKGAAGELVDQVAQDGEDIRRHFRTAFTDAGEAAKAGLAKAEEAAKRAAEKIKEELAPAVEQTTLRVNNLAKAWEKSDEAISPKRLQWVGEELATLNEQLKASGKSAKEWLAEFDTAHSQEEVERLQNAITSLVLEGKAVPLELAAAFDELQDRAAAATQSTVGASQRLGEAFKSLGIDIEQLKTGISSVEREAIDSFAEAAKAIKEVGYQGEEAADMLLKAFRAAMQSIDSEAGRAELISNLDQALQNNIITQKEYAEALREVAAAADDVLASTQKAIETSQKTTEQAVGGEKKKAAAAQQTSKAYQKQGQAAESAGNQAAQGSSKAASAGAALTRMFYGIRNSFYEVGEGAGQLFDKLYRDQTQFAVLSVGSWLKAVYQAKAAVQEQVTAAQENYDRAMTAQSGNLNAFLRAASRAKQGAHLLGEEKLETLKSAISSAKQQLDSLADSAASTTESLRTELIQMNGSAQDIERRRFEERQRELERQMKAASEQGASKAAREYAEAMALNEQIYQQRMNELKQDEAQQRQAARQERFQQQQQPAATQQQVTQQTSPTQMVEIRLPNGGTSSLSGDPDSVNQLLEFLNEAGMRATQ